MPLDNTPARLKFYADQYRQAILKPCSRGQIDRTASLPAYFLAGAAIGVTPTCSSAVYGAP